jgi:TonB family protein
VTDTKTVARLANHPNYRVWLASLLLALLFHLFSLRVPVDFTGVHTLPPRVEIQEMTPQQLDAIRKQWRSGTPILDDTSPESKEEPKDSRYISDRNIRVEQEEKARNPTPGLPDRGKVGERQPSPPKPNLGDLGVKLQMPPKTPTRNAGNAAIEGPAGSQVITDDQAVDGSQNLLNARESKHYSYFRRMYEAFYPVWISLANDAFREVQLPEGEYSTAVHVAFNASGDLVGLEVLESSGVKPFDDAAVAAWRKTPSFPNMPEDLLEADRRFHYRIRLNYIIRGGGFQMLPPDRLR